MTSELAVHTLGLTKLYGPVAVRGRSHVAYSMVRALDEVELRVPAGAVYALLGRNGAGKTTTLRLLMNLILPTRGTMSVLGFDPLRQAPQMLRHVGFVPAGHPCYGWMTVGQALQFIAGFHQHWDRELVTGLLAHSQLQPGAKVEDLSSGMRALLSVALAVGHRPRLLLVDEAFQGLDVVVRREIMRTLIELVQKDGTTILITGHEVSDLERICDHVGIISQGRLLVQDTLEGLKATYREHGPSLEDIFVHLVASQPEG